MANFSRFQHKLQRQAKRMSDLQCKRRPFPNELLLHILSLAEGKFPILLACSLVCRTWNRLFCPQLFQKISVTHYSFDAWLDFFRNGSPRLCQYVKELHIEWSDHTCVAPKWIPKCFRQMNKLRALHLNVNGWSTLSKLPAPFASGIAALLAAPRFRHLSLNGWSLEQDISDFRSTLSPCLATLESLSLAKITETRVIQGSSESKEVSVLQLDRLRTLEIYDVKHPLLEKGLLQCPNLECLLLKLYQPKAVVLPPCIPTRLTKLLVHAHAHGLQPVFGETFCPSELSVEIKGPLWGRCISWFQGCVNSLPFPRELRRIACKFNVDFSHQRSIDYPTPADYAVLFTFLEELGNLGQLQRVDLNILVTAPINMEPDDVDGTREVEQLKNAFAPLLEAGVMEAELVVQRWAFEYGRYEVVTQLVA